MINPGKSFNINDYIEIILRRIWFLIIPFIAILAGTGCYLVITPKEYRATTLILVTPQKVPEEFVRPTVTSKIEDRLSSIGQEIMSRTRLEQVIAQFKLYGDEAKSLSSEEIVDLMRKNIFVDIKGKEGYFAISYMGKDPQVVTLVTNKLASLFIEENLKLREQQAQGTSEFLSVELQTTKAKLEEQEKKITDFKQYYIGELPEQKDANLRVLDQLQANYQRIGDSLRSAQDRKLLIQKQLSDTETLIKTVAAAERSADEELLETSPSFPSATGPSPLTKINPLEQQLEHWKNVLMDLRSRYTENYPDVISTKKKIADLEAQIENSKTSEVAEDKGTSAEKANAQAASPAAKAVKSTRGKKQIKIDPHLNPRYKEIENQVIATDQEIARLKAEEVKVNAQIDKYRQRIENTPGREQAMVLLTRDYKNLQDTYQNLLLKSQEALQAENLERRQKGEQFKIIDPARLPEKPFKPDLQKTILFGLLIAVVGSLGTVFAREQMDHSFRDAEDVETTFKIKVLANIPRIAIK